MSSEVYIWNFMNSTFWVLFYGFCPNHSFPLNFAIWRHNESYYMPIDRVPQVAFATNFFLFSTYAFLPPTQFKVLFRKIIAINYFNHRTRSSSWLYGIRWLDSLVLGMISFASTAQPVMRLSLKTRRSGKCSNQMTVSTWFRCQIWSILRYKIAGMFRISK